jgi:hypothetical protein
MVVRVARFHNAPGHGVAQKRPRVPRPGEGVQRIGTCVAAVPLHHRSWCPELDVVALVVDTAAYGQLCLEPPCAPCARKAPKGAVVITGVAPLTKWRPPQFPRMKDLEVQLQQLTVAQSRASVQLVLAVPRAFQPGPSGHSRSGPSAAVGFQATNDSTDADASDEFGGQYFGKVAARMQQRFSRSLGQRRLRSHRPPHARHRLSGQRHRPPSTRLHRPQPAGPRSPALQLPPLLQARQRPAPPHQRPHWLRLRRQALQRI